MKKRFNVLSGAAALAIAFASGASAQNAYITNELSNNVSVINTATNTVTNTATVTNTVILRPDVLGRAEGSALALLTANANADPSSKKRDSG